LKTELEKYLLAHTGAESKLRYELDRQTHLQTRVPRMLSGHLQGNILKMFSQMIRPENILEIGTFTGYSALCLAEGLSETGKLITIEINDELADVAQSFFEKSTFAHKIEFIIGDAMQIIPKLEQSFDLVFIDADKHAYIDYYQMVLPKLRPGGFIIADNVLWDGKVYDKRFENDADTKALMKFNDFVQNDERVENVIFPVRDGFSLIRKLS
jgi:caffeoyl-CoA O-methyltransferase